MEKKKTRRRHRAGANKVDRCTQPSSSRLSIISVRAAFTELFLSLSASLICFHVTAENINQLYPLAQFSSESLHTNSMTECFSLFLYMAPFQERLMPQNKTCKEFGCPNHRLTVTVPKTPTLLLPKLKHTKSSNSGFCIWGHNCFQKCPGVM